MKIIKTSSGNIAFILDNEEINEFKKLQGNIIENNVVNPFFKLHNNSINFLKELYEHFNKQSIKRKDKTLKSLQRKYYITDLASLLKTLEQNGSCVIVRKNNSACHIDYFILNF